MKEKYDLLVNTWDPGSFDTERSHCYHQ